MNQPIDRQQTNQPQGMKSVGHCHPVIGTQPALRNILCQTRIIQSVIHCRKCHCLFQRLEKDHPANCYNKQHCRNPVAPSLFIFFQTTKHPVKTYEYSCNQDKRSLLTRPNPTDITRWISNTTSADKHTKDPFSGYPLHTAKKRSVSCL